MGHHFGELYKIRGIVTTTMSAFESRMLANIISKGIPINLSRFRDFLIFVVPPQVVGYLVYDQVEKKHQQLMRKNPADYENDS